MIVFFIFTVPPDCHKSDSIRLTDDWQYDRIENEAESFTRQLVEIVGNGSAPVQAPTAPSGDEKGCVASDAALSLATAF
ncbi:MAG: hypothetical protein JWL84_3640 [Rhodospirillales bacterium]|jgi:hypothetical protein|nr:hypothetical protein [Rhodospirillales bacterium]